MGRLSPYAKALVGGAASALAFAIPVVDDGLLVSEVLGIALAFLTGAGAVYTVPNGPPASPPGRHAAPPGGR